MYTLHLEREVAISHRLTYHNGKCSNLHGHNLLIKVDIKSKDIIHDKRFTEDGMIIDFGSIKKSIDGLDHADLNTIFIGNPFYPELEEQPTAERIAKYLAEEIERHSNNRYITEITVTVYEATNQYVTYTYNLEGE